VALVRALAMRNEPGPVPDSMGATLITGLNNWDRVASFRRRWQQEQGSGASAAAWASEFRRLAERTELYQDRLILLGEGPYSATPAEALGLPEDRWLQLSRVIRR